MEPPEEDEVKESSLDMFESDIDSEIGGYSSEDDASPAEGEGMSDADGGSE